MDLKKKAGILPAGLASGLATGLFGTGGGMVLVWALEHLTEERNLFPACVSIILPTVLLSLAVYGFSRQGLPWTSALPYLAGAVCGGTAAGVWGRKIPALWLHRILAALMIWSGLRCL